MTVAEKKAVRRQYPHGGRRARCLRPKGRLDGLPLEQWDQEFSATNTVFRPTSLVLSGTFHQTLREHLGDLDDIVKGTIGQRLECRFKINASKAEVSERMSYKTPQ